MVGEPLAQAIGEELEQLVVVLAGAAALPRGLGRYQLSDHSRLSAHRDSDFRQRQRTSIPIPVGFRLSALGAQGLRFPGSPSSSLTVPSSQESVIANCAYNAASPNG